MTLSVWPWALLLTCICGCSASDAGNGGPRANGGAAGAFGGSTNGVAGGGGATTQGQSGAGTVVAGSGGSNGASAGSGGASAATGGSGASSAGASTNGGNAGAAASAGASSRNPCAARPGLLFCDDFEAATAGAALSAPWSGGFVGSSDATTDIVAVEDAAAHAHSGTKSVHVHGVDYQTFLSYHDAAVLPQAGGKIFVRAFVRFDVAMTGGHNTFVLADTFAAPNTGNAWRVGEMNQMLMMTVNGDAHGWLSNQNFYTDGKPGVQFAAGAYTCLELMSDAPNQELEVWVDGVVVPDLHVTSIVHENYDFLHFGFEKYAGPASDFWFDDIAIGTQQIGCN